MEVGGGGWSRCCTGVKELEGVSFFFFFLHVKLMFLIMREELIRDGARARIGSYSVLKSKHNCP